MGRRRRGKRMGSMSILCITAIVGLSAMGVGYGYWTDSLNIGVGVTTGYTDIRAVVEGYNDSLKFTLSEDGRKLNISGEVYPSFNDNVTVMVRDEGSIPSIFSGEIWELAQNEIAQIQEQNYGEYSRYSLADDKEIKKFAIGIRPNENQETTQRSYSISQTNVFDIQDEMSEFQIRINSIGVEISSIEEEINRLHEEIIRLDVIVDHEFKYELEFEQGI